MRDEREIKLIIAFREAVPWLRALPAIMIKPKTTREQLSKAF